MSQNELHSIPTAKQLWLLEEMVIKILVHQFGDETVRLHYRYQRLQIPPRKMKMDSWNHTEDNVYGGSVSLRYSTKGSPEPKVIFSLDIPVTERFCRRIARWRVLRAYCSIYGSSTVSELGGTTT
jgi:hypothetical protein